MFHKKIAWAKFTGVMYDFSKRLSFSKVTTVDVNVHSSVCVEITNNNKKLTSAVIYKPH